MKNFLTVGASLWLSGLVTPLCLGHADVPQTQRLPVVEVPSTPSTATVPRVDGSPGDPAWENAAKISNFSLALGKQSHGLTPLPTEVRLLWDKQFLYLRFLCRDVEIYAPIDSALRDAPFYRGDAVEVFIDPKGDGRQYIELQVSPTNGVFDQLFTLTADPKFDQSLRLDGDVVGRDLWRDLSWGFEGLKSATGRFEGGWIADLALPAKPLLRRLGLKEFTPLTLRANFVRYDWQPGAAPDGGGAAGVTTAGKDDPLLPRRHLVAMNWSPVAFGQPHVSPAAMGFVQLVSQ